MSAGSRVALLRGINIGPSNRIAMPALRELLTSRGFAGVATYVQSGNVVLASDLEPSVIAAEISAAITDGFGLQIPVVVRSSAELAAVVASNPLPEATIDPKRFQVSFLDGSVLPDLQDTRDGLAEPGERVVVREHEIYVWTPDGIARSKLWAKLSAKGGLGKGVTATSRNWTTVTALLEMVCDAG
jgi:uncharacterized protein (DUF1697 family)